MVVIIEGICVMIKNINMVKNKMCIEFCDFFRVDFKECFCCLFNILFFRSILVF